MTERPGDTIGPYKLLQQIGEGGMGVVYMAEQTQPIERRVALKIIKPGMDTRQVIARFEAERQTLAMMDHPNIARALDAGVTDAGRPYFVMELVKGVPITEYCDEHHLTPRERLELFSPVCQAIQHAHQKGIIHRDIKPSNVLVADYDDHPVPKVIDFGVAKAIDHRLTEKTMFTEFGQVLGTFEYMSPEQAKLNQWDVDTRTDIYSLGVLLYELLSGETPFDRQRLRSAAFDELLRIIREDDPPRPSMRLSTSESLPSIAANRKLEPRKLTTTIRGELDWIAMKALEKDRTRRYDTVSKLAEDVEHYLNNEAVEACPPSRAYRLRKVIHRNKSALATIGTVAAALVAATAISLWQAREAESQRRLAVAKANEAQAETDKANAVVSLLEDMLSTAKPTHATLIEIMDTFSPTLDERLKDQPEVESKLRRIIGRTYGQLSQYSEANWNLTRALELHRKTYPDDKLQTAALLSELVYQRWQADHPDDTSDLVEQVIAITREHNDVEGEASARLALVCNLVFQGRIEQAETAALDTLKLLEAHDLRGSMAYAGSKWTLSNIRRALGDTQDADQLIDEAFALYKVQSEPLPWNMLNTRGKILLEQGDVVAAEQMFRQSLETSRKSFPERNHRVKSPKFWLMLALQAQQGEMALSPNPTQTRACPA